MVDWSELCKDCGECCGPVPFNADEWLSNKKNAQHDYKCTPYVGNTVIPVTKTGDCVFLTDDKRCAIYNNRPDICRKQGTIARLPCPKLEKVGLYSNEDNE